MCTQQADGHPAGMASTGQKAAGAAPSLGGRAARRYHAQRHAYPAIAASPLTNAAKACRAEWWVAVVSIWHLNSQSARARQLSMRAHGDRQPALPQLTIHADLDHLQQVQARKGGSVSGAWRGSN